LGDILILFDTGSEKGRHLLAFSINKRNQYGGRETLHCTAIPINDFEGFLHIFYC